ncbi:MAG: STN domain-containing protein [Butyricimonas faecihominis]
MQLVKALSAIKKRTKLDFFYNNQEINAVGKVSVRCQNVSLDEALRQVLKEFHVPDC